MSQRQHDSVVPLARVSVSAYTVPTDYPEADGTITWDSTTIVIVEAEAGGRTGIGYTYADTATAKLIATKLSGIVTGMDAMSPMDAYMRMWRETRNLGRPGIVSMGISAVDTALWGVKAKLLELPLATLLGKVRGAALVYGSGGFTSYSDQQLAEQLGGWAQQGLRYVKMKIGRNGRRDVERVRVAREAIGNRTELFVDANGAYSRKQALEQAEVFADRFGVSWFEEPVSSDDLEGLRLVRDRAPAGMEVAAGEYGYDLFYFRRMLEAGAVDVLQADMTRCGGVTGFMQIATLCEAHNVPLSAHTAPAQHVHVCCAAVPVRHIEYFHDHVRIERLFFDGLPELVDGELRPDLSRPGAGLELKRKDAVRFAA